MVRLCFAYLYLLFIVSCILLLVQLVSACASLGVLCYVCALLTDGRYAGRPFESDDGCISGRCHFLYRALVYVFLFLGSQTRTLCI